MTTAASGRRLTYQPALDGLRGLAVAAVVLFHHELSWARGGYLGVSTFFTLSGFLICSLLLAEHRATGAVDLRAFWGRRFRRLMPASLAALGLVVAYGALAADSTQLSSLRGDLLSALGYVANWRFTLSGTSYGDLFTTPSPVLHFWSLAIEEQFYVLFPLLVAAVLGRGAARRRPDLAIVLAGLVLASVGATAWLARDASVLDRAYFGTDARAAELLIGALLAVWWHRTGDERRASISRRVAMAAPLALGALALCWTTVAQSSTWLYRGGFALYAIGSAIVILGAISERGLVRQLLATGLLRQIGRYSYGIYVYHWPIFQWLTPQRTELSSAPLLAVRVGATAAVAVLSFHLLEQPVRNRTLLAPERLRLAAGAAVAALAIGAVVVTSGATAPTDFERLQEVAISRETPANPEGRPTIGFFGDSTALITGLGFADWQRTTRVFGEEPGSGHTQLGCGFLGATPHLHKGMELVSKEECDHTLTLMATALDFASPDICAVMSGPWNVADRKLDGSSEWTTPGDPIYDQHLRDAMEQMMATFEAHDCVAIWILMPYSVQGTVDGVQPTEQWSENEPARVDRLNELVTEIVAAHPDSAAVVDLPGWMDTLPDGQLDTRLRQDLVHFSWEDGTAREVADRFLGRAIYDAYASVVGEEVAPPLPDAAFEPTQPVPAPAPAG